MPGLTRLDFRRLVRELQGRGATRVEAERLAKLAELVSRTSPRIDITFADALEQLLLKERTSASLAEIIRLGKVLDADPSSAPHQPRLYVLPVAGITPRRRRTLAGIAAAAIVVPIVVIAVALTSRGGVSDRDVYADEGNWRSSPRHARVVTAAADMRRDGNRIDGPSATDAGSPVSPPPSRFIGNGCSISSDRSKGAGVVPVPSFSCHSSSESNSSSSPLKGPPTPPTS